MSWFWEAMILLVVVVPVVIFFGYAAFDVLRRHGIGVAHRALLLIAFCVFPILGPLVYLVVRPPGLTAQEEALAGDERSRTAELTRLADLHDRGTLSDADFEHVKSQIVHESVGLPPMVHEQRGS